MRTIISSFETEIRGHVYHVDIIDQREYRKWQKNSGMSYSLAEPYEYTAKCDDEGLSAVLRHIGHETYTKPSKKCIISEIEYEHRHYDDLCKQAAFQEEQRKEAERIKEEQRLAHEEWLDEPAMITNRQFEVLMSRLSELESRVSSVEDLADTVDRRTCYRGYEE